MKSSLNAAKAEMCAGLKFLKSGKIWRSRLEELPKPVRRRLGADARHSTVGAFAPCFIRNLLSRTGYSEFRIHALLLFMR